MRFYFSAGFFPSRTAAPETAGTEPETGGGDGTGNGWRGPDGHDNTYAPKGPLKGYFILYQESHITGTVSLPGYFSDGEFFGGPDPEIRQWKWCQQLF